MKKDNDLYRIIQFVLQHKSFYFRALLFLVLAFVALPFFQELISTFLLPEQSFSFTIDRSTPFFLIILILTYLKYEKQFLSFSFRSEWTNDALFRKGTYLVAMGLSLYLYFFIKHMFWWQFVQENIHLVIYVTSALLLIIYLLLFLMIFGDEFLKTFTTPVFSVVFIMIVFFSMSYMLTTAWRFFSGTVAQFVSQLLHLTFENISYEIASVPSLELYSFKVLIGNACSGIDSLSLFFSIYLLIMMYDFSRIRLKRALALLPVGLLGMFIMTVFRIYILMVVGKFNAELSIGLFHDNLGWIFFVVYIILFWYFAYGFILEKKHLPSKKA